ncbi:YjbF family lipoprotein [Aliidiomarina sp. Khilg15.8]
MHSLKKILALGAVLTLTACNAVTDDAKRTLEYAFEKRPDVELSAQELEEFPYTALYVNQDGSPRSLVVLGYADSDGGTEVLSWISSDRETLVTRHGRVVRTVDLHTNLLATSDVDSDPLRCIVTNPESCLRSWQRALDFEVEGKRFSRLASSTFKVLGPTTINLPAGETDVVHVREVVDVNLTDKSFVNDFWIENDGHVVKSRQHILFNEPSFTLTQAKWVGR